MKKWKQQKNKETEWKWNWFSFLLLFWILVVCIVIFFGCWKWKGFTSQIKWIILRFPYPQNLISFSISTKPRNWKKYINTKLFFFCYLRNSTYLPTKSMFIALLPPEPANVLIDGKYGTGYNKYPFVKGKVYNEIQYMHTHTHTQIT